MAQALLKIAGLCKSFGALRATDSFSLEVAAGETHALIGPNGAGKTTLIAQVSGEMAPDAGAIYLGGEDITALSVQERVERGVSRSFQITSIFSEFSALQNVAMAVQATQGHSFSFFGDPWADSAVSGRAMELLERVHLAPRAGIMASELAHGEHRQLELAMALALRPKLILLDEPTAGMGGDDSRRMLALLQTLKTQVTMLLVEHDMDVVFSLSDRVTVMVYGAAIASGTPQEIQADPAVRAAYLGGD
jgi:branched-chain amino acid transport system ATP-binding protein